MNLSKELTKRANAHLDEVRKHLGTLPADERQEILQSIESHIYDALENRSDGDPTSALLDAIIAEMDPPESYGELLPPSKKMKWKPLLMIPGLGLMAVIAALMWTRAESKQAPVVINTFPLNRSNAVDPSVTELRVTFNKDMLTDRMWSWCIESQDTAPKFISEGTKFTDKRTCVAPVELEPNKTYVVWINTQKHDAFRDINHNPAAPYRLEFRTSNAQPNPRPLPTQQPLTERTLDPIGHWTSVDFVSSIKQFDPQKKSWSGSLVLTELSFLPNGKTDRPFWTWKGDLLHHSGDNTDAKFLIKKISGTDYLFLEWMSGDVIHKGLPPKYYVLKKDGRERTTSSSEDTPGPFLRPVERPSSPQPPSGKYAFQIIKVEVPAETVQALQSDVEKIIRQPEAKILEYPILLAGPGESATNDQTKTVSFALNSDSGNNDAAAEEKSIRLGDSISITVNKGEMEMISYHLNMYHLEQDGFLEHKLTGGFLEKAQPRFKKKAMDTDLKQKPNSWTILGGEIEPRPDGKKVNQLTCIRIIPPAELAIDIEEQQAKAKARMRKDREIYSREELTEIETLYQVANKQWRSKEGIESLKKMVSKYKSANRTGCALLYLGQMSTGDEQLEYLQQAIDDYSDCFYGDGVQVGAYARFVLALRYQKDGKIDKAAKLADEIKTSYPNSISHKKQRLAVLLQHYL